MFRILGIIVSRGWPILLAGWLFLLGWAASVAPSWDDVAESGQFSFLPSDVPSNRAKELLKQAFPEQQPTSNMVLVLSREDGGLGQQDRDFVAQVLKPALQDVIGNGTDNGNTPGTRDPTQARAMQIRSLIDPGEGELLKSSDNKATLVIIELPGEILSRGDWPTIAKVEELIERLQQRWQVPRGLDIHVTGNAVVGRDVRQEEAKSAAAIEQWTIILVIGLLLVIYRAPLVALIPLATVFFATQLSLKLLAILAQMGYVQVSDTLRIYVTVLCYGAGVDYCLFLIARYREELERGGSVAQAVAEAIGRVGGTIAASAGTVICGIGTMAFAQFGKYHQAGICIPLCLTVVLLCALTFTPCLLRLFGTWAFWPNRPEVHHSPLTTHHSPLTLLGRGRSSLARVASDHLAFVCGGHGPVRGRRRAALPAGRLRHQHRLAETHRQLGRHGRPQGAFSLWHCRPGNSPAIQ
jgi:RND superfamily putative drug exporter